MDPMLGTTVPADVSVCRVRTVPARLTRAIGLGSLAVRALPYLWHAGNRLLANGNRLRQTPFDLVYFSTTQFPVMILGPAWKRKFHVPYVVDFQDPWLSDYYERSGTAPPGGKVRHSLSRKLAANLEPRVMRDVSEVISVSPAYVKTLTERYPQLDPDQFTVLPFGAPKRDFEMLQSLGVMQQVFDRSDGKQHWVYVGAAGKIMAPALRLLFSAMQRLRDAAPAEWQKLRLHFVGTSYAPVGRAEKTVEPIAQEFGIAHLVEERTERVGYFEALQTLVAADGLLVIGSDSPAYTPSKIYPYVLARRPLLAVLHRDSPAAEMLRRCRAGHVVAFTREDGRSSGPLRSAVEALEQTRRDIESGNVPDVDWQEFSQYTAREMTRKQCEVFDRAVGDVVKR